MQIEPKPRNHIDVTTRIEKPSPERTCLMASGTAVGILGTLQ